MKAVVAAFNQEKALVGAFSMIVQPFVEPMDRFAALILTFSRFSVHEMYKKEIDAMYLHEGHSSVAW